MGLFNRSAAPAQMKVKWSEVVIDKKSPQVRDLWAHKDVEAPAEFSTEVPSHGGVLLRVR